MKDIELAEKDNTPICQDTGIVNVFLKIGMDVRWEGFTGSLEDAINEGVRRGYNHPDNTLRASVVDDPQFARKNTKDNTPAVIFTQIVPGNTLDITVAAKGGGSENKSKMIMLNPSDSVVDWVLKTVPTMGAGWCPPGMLGIGIGGTAEKAVLLAKESLMDDLDMYQLLEKSSKGAALTQVEDLRLELYHKVNALGIGAQGLGGLTTVLDVKIKMYPTHAASKPVAMIPNCAATRHAHFVLDGTGPSFIDAGAHVKAGQLLAEIDTPETDLESQQTRAARQQLVASLALARSSAARWETLRKSDAVSQQEVDERKGAVAQQEAALAAADANIKRLEELQSYRKVYAPFAGVITKRSVDTGSLITAGNASQQQLFYLAQTAPLANNVSLAADKQMKGRGSP